MKVLVVGGTGFIGSHLVRKLLDSGTDVVVFHSGRTNPAPKVKTIIGDRASLTDYKGEFRRFGPDIVIDLITFTENEAKGLIETFDEIAGRIVLISSMDVYRNYGLFIRSESGASNKIPITERSSLRSELYPYREMAENEDEMIYHYDKIPAEKIVMDAPNAKWTILRLPKVYGVGDRKHRLYEYLKRIDDGREYILLDKKHANWLWTRGYVENVADGIVSAALDRRAENQIYNIGDKNTFTEAEWVKFVARRAGWKGKVVALDQKDLPPHLQTPYDYDRHLEVSSEKIRDELGFADSVSLTEAVDRTIAWERENKPEEFDPAMFDYESEDRALEEAENSEWN